MISQSVLNENNQKTNLSNQIQKINQKSKEVIRMSKFKKILSVAVVFAMVLGMAIPAFAVADDVKGTEFESAAKKLGELSIMVGDAGTGDFRPNDNIKRSEFAKISVVMLGLGNAAQNSTSTTKFTDIPTGHWAIGYINVAASQGIVIGDPEGTFRPDDKINYAEALTMLVRLLGYSPSVRTTGWPVNFIAKAAELRITKDVKVNAYESAIRGLIAKLVENSLTIDLMEQVGFGNDINYEVQEDKSLLTEKMGIEKYDEVQVIANEYTSLTGSATKDDEVKVDLGNEGTKSFKVNDTDAKNYIGYLVDLYVNDDDEIVSIVSAENQNETLSVNADKIVTDDSKEIFSTTNFVFEDEKEEIEAVTIATGAKLIKNGKKADLTIANLTPSEGKVMLLDTDVDDEYDVVFITETENNVVDEIVTGRNKIKFKTEFSQKATLELDPEDDSVTFRILKAGDEIELKELKEWDVVSIAESEDDELITLFVESGKTVEGVVSEEDGSDKYIDGKKYEVAGNIEASEVALGDEGIFYLDFYGRISAYDTESESDNYALLIEAGKTEGIEAGFQFKLLTSKGQENVYNLATKVKYDGNKDDDEDIVSALQTAGVIGVDFDVAVTTLVTYELDATGNISEINVVDKDVLVKNAEATEGKYSDDDDSIDSQFYVDDKTIVFDVTEGDVDEYAVKTSGYFKDDDTYTVKAYDVDDSIARILVVIESASSGRIGSNVVVVDKISMTKNADDEDVYKLYAYKDGERISILTTEDVFGTGEDAKAVNADVYFKDLAQGSVITYKTGADNQLNEFHLLFNGVATTYGEPSDDDLQVLYGQVDSTNSRGVVVNGVNFTTSGADVYEFDAATDDIEAADTGDIVEEDMVFIMKYDGKVKNILIVK